MPLPAPRTGEAESKFISRCVSSIFSEGTLNNKPVDADSEADRKQATAACYTRWRKGKSIALTMKMTRVQKKGNRYRWQARCNTGEFDLLQERFDESFFDDVIANFYRVQEASSKRGHLPAGMPIPIVDISHYSLLIPKSERYKARVGYPVKLWRDGRNLFASGYFDDTPLGRMSARAAQQREPEDRRVSIVVFPDYSLTKSDAGRTTYHGEDGNGSAYLDSLAMTATPCDPGTQLSVQLEVKAMGTVKEDALKVLGDDDEAQEAIEELEALRSHKSKSETVEGAVIKSDETGETTGETEELESEEATEESTDEVSEETTSEEGSDSGKSESESDESESEDESKSNVLKTVLPVIAGAIDKRLDEVLQPLADLPERLDGIEAKIDALASDETAKITAALESEDGDWLTKAILGNSVQRSTPTVKGKESEPVQEADSTDGEYGTLFGNPEGES